MLMTFFSYGQSRFMYFYSAALNKCLLPTGSEEREVLGVGSIPVAILPSRQDMKTFALQ